MLIKSFNNQYLCATSAHAFWNAHAHYDAQLRRAHGDVHAMTTQNTRMPTKR